MISQWHTWASVWVPADVDFVARFPPNRRFFNEIVACLSRIVLRGRVTVIWLNLNNMLLLITDNNCLDNWSKFISLVALLTLLIKVDKVTFLVVNHVIKCSFAYTSVSTASNFSHSYSVLGNFLTPLFMPKLTKISLQPTKKLSKLFRISLTLNKDYQWPLKILLLLFLGLHVFTSNLKFTNQTILADQLFLPVVAVLNLTLVT